MHDPVNRPAHYTDGQIEVIDFIDDKQLSYSASATRSNTFPAQARKTRLKPLRTCKRQSGI